MIADRRALAVIAPLRPRCSVSLETFAATIAHVRSLIGQKYDHAANMNSKSTKELLKLRNSALVCRHSKRKGMKVCFSSSGGKFCEFFVTFELVIHPLTVKKRPCALIWACVHRKNTVPLQYL